MNQWLTHFSQYSFNEGNCQLFVHDFVWEFLRIDLPTQNREATNWFETFVKGGLVGGAAFLGVAAVSLIGILIVNPSGFH